MCLSRGELRVDDGRERDVPVPTSVAVCETGDGDESEDATTNEGLEAPCDALSTGYVRPICDCCSDWVLRHWSATTATRKPQRFSNASSHSWILGSLG